MTTQLPERLRELADDAPGPLSAVGLWHAGLRRHRRRALATAATVGTVVVLIAGTGYGSWHSRQPAPASPPATSTGPMAVPSRFFRPSPWLPGTSSPGRLVAVLGATRDHFPWGQDKNALVGVAAGSQRYRFLDLPGQSPDVKDAALSPDGRHLAYWINGSPTGSSTLGDRSTVGVADLDLSTGKVERRVISTAHGLTPEMLTWTSDDHLAVTAGKYNSAEVTSFSGSTTVYFIMWEARQSSSDLVFRGADGGDPALMTVVPRMRTIRQIPVTSTVGFGGMVQARLLRVWDANHTSTQSVRLSQPLQSVAYDAGSRRIAGTRGNPEQSGSASGPLLVGRVADGHVHLTSVLGDDDYLRVLSWSDRRHVVTEQLTSTGVRFWVVDVLTGQRTPLTTTGYQATGSSWFGVLGLATDALRRPVSATGIAPPWPWNPRWVAGGALALWGVCLAGVLVLRRRRRVRS